MSKIICLDISVLNDKNKTGVGVYTYELIKALLKINKRDKFILFGFATFKTFNFLKNLEFRNYPNVEMKIYKMPAKLFRRLFLFWQKIDWPNIEKLVGPIDIFHSFNWNLPPVKNSKMVATVFDMTPNLTPNYHQKKTIQLDNVRLNRIRNKADLVITISENSKKDFLKFAQGKRTEVIYPGVSDIFMQKITAAKSKKVLKKYDLEKGYILAVGTLEPRKNIRYLIKAYLKSNLAEKLVLVGNWGWEKSDLLENIKSNKDKIILTGFIPDEDLVYLYHGALCLVYPSLYEGFGIPILEAMSCGVSVISSNTSSLPEVGLDAVIYIDPSDIDSLVSALRIIKDPQLRTSLIKKGLQQAKKFSWEKSANKLNQLYQML